MLLQPRRPLGKLIIATTKHRIESEELLLPAWSLQSDYSQTAAGKWTAFRPHRAVIMFQSSSIRFGTAVDYRDQQWKTEPGCFLLGRLCLNVLLWKCVSGRTHSVANRSLFSKQSCRSVLSGVQETSISARCQFSISDSCLPVREPKTHTGCQFCFRGLKPSSKNSQMWYVFSWCHLREALDDNLQRLWLVTHCLWKRIIAQYKWSVSVQESPSTLISTQDIPRNFKLWL